MSAMSSDTTASVRRTRTSWHATHESRRKNSCRAASSLTWQTARSARASTNGRTRELTMNVEQSGSTLATTRKDHRARNKAPKYRLAALRLGEGVAELRHPESALFVQVSEHVLGIAQRFRNRPDVDDLVLVGGFPGEVMALGGQPRETEAAILLERCV